MGFSKPKVDQGAIRRAQEAADRERARLAAEKEAAAQEKARLAEERGRQASARRRRAIGRGSLITNTGGELGTGSTLG